MKATTNKYKKIKGINKTVPLYCKSNSVDNKNAIKVTYNELVKLRDNSQLIPGAFYRIIDYEFTFSSSNVKNAGHQFDIVLVALNENKLAEEGWAMEHPTEVYDVTFAMGEGPSRKCYVAHMSEDEINLIDVETLLGIPILLSELENVDEINKTAITGISYETLNRENLLYNYFQNSNLSAWKVWYCLDNDKSRFNWAKQNRNDIPSYMNNAYVVTSIMNDSEQTLIIVRNKDKDNDNNNIGVKLYAYDVIYDETDFEINLTLYTIEESINIGTMPVYIFYNHSFVKDSDINVIDIHKYKYINGKGVIYRLIDEYNNDCCCDFKNYMFKDNDYMTDYKYILNGNQVHDNKICIDNHKTIKYLPNISLSGDYIIFNTIVNSTSIHLGNGSVNVDYNNIINCTRVQVNNECYSNILKGCDSMRFYTYLYTSTLINAAQIEALYETKNIYIVNCTNINLQSCECITMFNCNYVNFLKNYIYNLFAKDIKYIIITSDSTTSFSSPIKYVEILPGIEGVDYSNRITITLPLWTGGCTIVKPNSVNEIIIS